MAKKLLSVLGCDSQELSLLLTDDTQLRSLNQAHRGIDKATDVLSYSMSEGEGSQYSGNLLGDVVISLETAKRQADEYQVSFAEELLRLVIHGVLHLRGYEHENVSKAVERKMQDKEKELFDLLAAEFDS